MKNYLVIIEAQINIKAKSAEEAERLVAISFGEVAKKLEFTAIPDKFEDEFEQQSLKKDL